MIGSEAHGWAGKPPGGWPGQANAKSGLTDAGFARIERDYEFEFANDHRAFLGSRTPAAYSRTMAAAQPVA